MKRSSTIALLLIAIVVGFYSCKKEELNAPPLIPSSPLPETEAVVENIYSILSWTCSDPDADTLVYDLYFGTESLPPLIESGLIETHYETGLLQMDKQYYWKVVARDSEFQTHGPVWSFSTMENLAPGMVELIYPTPNIIAQPGKIEIRWQCSDPENDPVTYDIYIGNSTPPTLFEAEYPTQSLIVDFEYAGDYFLRIDSKDPFGNLTEGKVLNIIIAPQKKLKQLTCYSADTVHYIKTYQYNDEGHLSEFEKQEWMSIGPVMVFHWRERKQFVWEESKIVSEDRQWYYWSSYNIKWYPREASLVYNYDSTGLLKGMALAETPDENKFFMEYDDQSRIIRRQEGFSEWDKSWSPIFYYEYISENEITITKETPSDYGSSFRIQEYVLDDHPNPEWVEQYPTYMMNNFIKQTYKAVLYEYEYEYDNEGFPLVRQQILPDTNYRWVYEYY